MAAAANFLRISREDEIPVIMTVGKSQLEHETIMLAVLLNCKNSSLTCKLAVQLWFRAYDCGENRKCGPV